MAMQSAPETSRHPGGSENTRTKISKLLTGFWPSEVRAIHACRVFLQRESHCKITIEETLDAWEGRIGKKWRAEKMRIDGQMQLREIEQHKSQVAEKEGKELDWEAAAHDWIERHSKAWRDWWESQPASCPDTAFCP